jgi:regulatory protein
MREARKRKPPQRFDEQKLWEYSLRLLAGRAYSIDALRARLRKRAADGVDIDALIERLKEYHLLDDRKFAESFAAARLENNGFGKQRVLRDLRQKRIPSALAEQVVEATFAESDEEELVEAFLKRKFRSVKLSEYLSVPKHLAAAYRRLRYAGFSSSVSIAVLRRFSEQADELDGMEEGEE